MVGHALTHTFTISNSGLTALTLTGTPLVSLSGAAALDFHLVVAPTTPITPGGTTTLRVRFSPLVIGTRVTTLTIANNDPDENPYNFAIQGSGTASSSLLYLPLIIK
jgi:hypothetical protein